MYLDFTTGCVRSHAGNYHCCIRAMMGPFDLYLKVPGLCNESHVVNRGGCTTSHGSRLLHQIDAGGTNYICYIVSS